MLRAIRLTFLLVLVPAMPALAQERTCPAGFNDVPAMPSHFDQASVIRMPLERAFAAGQQIFVTNFNGCDGAGRPATAGTGTPRTPDSALAPRFSRVSAPDANSCAGCHAQPQPGGAGDFVANVFVLAQASVPVAKFILNDDFTNTWLERNTLGMFASGAIEMLGREMTDDLRSLETHAISQANSTRQNVSVALTTKGVSFGSLIAHPDGSVDASGVSGVDPDLIVKPFSRKGVFRSIREFTVTAFNQHHGLQAVERFGEGTDPGMLYQRYTEGAGADLFDGLVAPFVRQARFELGLPALLGDAPLISQLMDSATIALAMTVRELDSPLKRAHSNLRYVGPALEEEATKWVPPGRPLVLVSFSTTYMRHEDALRRTFAALDGIDAFAVCTLGHALSRDRMPVSPNVSIYDWLPHEAILPHAAAVVTHAGHSTLMAALAHGVLLVCMPMGRYQDANAERAGTLGARVTLPPSAAPAEISAATKNVLANPSYRDAAGRLAAQIRELGRGERAFGELEGLLK